MNASTINMMICGFVLFMIAVYVFANTLYKRAMENTPQGYPRGKVVGKTSEQRNNVLILFFTLIIMITGSYFLYRYFDNVLMLCPIGLFNAFWLGLMLFVLVNYRAAVAMDKNGVPASLTVLDKYRDHVESGRDDYYLILQPPGVDTPYQYSVPYKVYDDSAKGNTVQVRYLPGNPKVIRVEVK